MENEGISDRITQFLFLKLNGRSKQTNKQINKVDGSNPGWPLTQPSSVGTFTKASRSSGQVVPIYLNIVQQRSVTLTLYNFFKMYPGIQLATAIKLKPKGCAQLTSSCTTLNILPLSKSARHKSGSSLSCRRGRQAHSLRYISVVFSRAGTSSHTRQTVNKSTLLCHMTQEI